MSHITEGLLHAHLDGAIGHEHAEEWLLAEAHLSVCEDCRRRLEEARQLRTAASNVLSAASAPLGNRPDFEHLVAKAGGTSSVRRRSVWWNSTSRLAWAASLVLAVGAGWLGRELLVQTGRDMPSVVQTESLPQAPEQAAAFGDAPNSRGLAAPPSNEPEVAVMRKSEEQKMSEEFRQDVEPARERDAVAQLSGERANAPTCYAADPQGDLQLGLAVADRAVAEDDRKNATPIAPSEIRLLAEGTVMVTARGSQMVGSWEAMGTDSVRVTLVIEETELKMRLEQTDTGLVGTAVSSARIEALNEADPAGAGPAVTIQYLQIECESAP